MTQLTRNLKESKHEQEQFNTRLIQHDTRR